MSSGTLTFHTHFLVIPPAPPATHSPRCEDPEVFLLPEVANERGGAWPRRHVWNRTPLWAGCLEVEEDTTGRKKCVCGGGFRYDSAVAKSEGSMESTGYSTVAKAIDWGLASASVRRKKS